MFAWACRWDSGSRLFSTAVSGWRASAVDPGCRALGKRFLGAGIQNWSRFRIGIKSIHAVIVIEGESVIKSRDMLRATGRTL